MRVTGTTTTSDGIVGEDVSEHSEETLKALIGRRVCRRADNLDSEYGSEFGVILNAWIDEQLEAVDCYVVFFGDRWPTAGQPPIEKPYVLRYLLSSLELLPGRLHD
jgi:hypothetical protein